MPTTHNVCVSFPFDIETFELVDDALAAAVGRKADAAGTNGTMRDCSWQCGDESLARQLKRMIEAAGVLPDCASIELVEVTVGVAAEAPRLADLCRPPRIGERVFLKFPSSCRLGPDDPGVVEVEIVMAMRGVERPESLAEISPHAKIYASRETAEEAE